MDKQEDALSAFGRRLSQLREERGLSIAELASRTGLGSGYIARIEAGQQDIPITVIFVLADGLSVPAARLLGTL
ncbi:MAG TPA: helix-turn-helix transcriptional regulator [Puia sp.]|nr:helix-turn-helix transcriptional regulator [Puia sp.]